MSPLKIVSIGSCSVDAYIKSKSKKTDVHITGDGVNTAKNYKALGFPSKARIWVSQDKYGKHVVSNLSDNDIVTVYDKTQNHRTPHQVFSEGHLMIEGGDDLPEILRIEDIKLITSGNWVHLSGLKCSPSSITKIFDAALEEKPIPLTWSPGPWQIKAGFHAFENMLKHTVFLSMNKEELLQFTGRRTKEQAIKDILHTGVKILIITNHQDVIEVISTTERFTLTPPHGKEVDHEGAGARWTSTFTAFAMTKFDIPSAMQLATFHTSLLIKKEGADSSLFSMEELEKKFKREKKNYLVHIRKYR